MAWGGYRDQASHRLSPLVMTISSPAATWRSNRERLVLVWCTPISAISR